MSEKRRRDYVALVESAYDYAGANDEDWTQAMAEAALPILGRGGAVLVHPYDARDPTRLHIGVVGVAGADRTDMTRNALDFDAGLSPAEVRLFYCATPQVEFLREIRRKLKRTSEAPTALLRQLGIGDMIGVRGHNPHGKGIALCATSPSDYKLAPAARQALSRVAVHLAAAYRLRYDVGSPGLDAADAIFSPRGRVEHLREPVREAKRGASDLQRAVAEKIEAGKLRREEPEKALELWRALVAGRWSIIHHRDTDGKRYILARRNDPEVASPAALTRSERLAAVYASWGHPSKLIAYELGLSQPTVSELLKGALRKLGLKSRAELVRFFGPQPPYPEEPVGARKSVSPDAGGVGDSAARGEPGADPQSKPIVRAGRRGPAT
jgi:DNA-binding NarL/FixJ family response regulator